MFTRPLARRSVSTASPRTARHGPAEAMVSALAELSPKWAALRARQRALSAPRPVPRDLSHFSKRPEDSLLRVALPFGRDAELRARYVNAAGHLRVGLLLEELDAFAACVAQLHCDDGDTDTAPPLLVTAAFDRLDLLSYPLHADVDLELRGCVSFVGRTSINIDMDVLRVPPLGSAAPPTPVLCASTTFVARDAAGAPVSVPPLLVQGAHDTALWEAGRSASEARKAAAASSLLLSPPTVGELATIHAVFMESQRGGAGRGQWVPPSISGDVPSASSTFTDTTKLSSTHIMMPQDRNIYGKVFGGTLMRLAFETAFACGWRATGSTPRFLAMDAAQFRAPVEVGSLVRMDASIAYAEGSPHSRTYSVTVDALMEAPGAGGKEQHVCSFLFVFYASDGGQHVPRFVPRTYTDAMTWLHALRRQQIGANGARARKITAPVARF